MSTAKEFRIDDLQIASPCSMEWDAMTGDDRQRHCEECQLNVYNVAGMTADEALDLIRSAEGRVCMRLTRRADGTLLTRDCPVGLRALRRRLRLARVRAVALVATLISSLWSCARLGSQPLTQDQSRQTPKPAGVEIMGEVEMGDLEVTMGVAPAPDHQMMGRIRLPSPQVEGTQTPPSRKQR